MIKNVNYFVDVSEEVNLPLGGYLYIWREKSTIGWVSLHLEKIKVRGD